ncbi:hypothetical protein EA007_05920 [Vibrio anguillarum]|uniref:hypothetical protein n=1 Tax=Vibrio anguillarum TaxID=55601 RepID=UPI00188AE947|nr:hypothetical protein [Vibrio anguillarum]MBF4250531.1 hypothetical protein [Vibrio anguillarum]
MFTVLVDSSGNIYLPSSVGIPFNVEEVKLNQLPDIDLYLYQGGQLIIKNNADQIVKERAAFDTAFQNDKVLEKRQLAYKNESDSLYMEWQYDQTPEKEQAWRNKVAEIKTRYPLPAES